MLAPFKIENESSNERGEAESPCRIVVFYDDTTSRNRAEILCQFLIDKSWLEVEFDVSWWKFSFFNDPVLAAQAVNEATRADIVIFSVKPYNLLPERVVACNELWLVQRKLRGGLLGMLTESDSFNQLNHGALHKYLKSLAHRGHLEFVAAGARFNRRVSQVLDLLALGSKPHFPAETEFGDGPPEYDHCGINE